MLFTYWSGEVAVTALKLWWNVDTLMPARLAHRITRADKGHTPVAAPSVRSQEKAQAPSEGVGDTLVLGLAPANARRCSASRIGGLPKCRLYSRLKCEASS